MKYLAGRALQENVKMFLQAGSSAPVFQVLSLAGRIAYVRWHNKNRGLVTVDGKAGYVLRSELAV
jgi:hypothetical protein